MKRIVALLMLPVLLFAISGCSNHRDSDIGNRVVLQGIGVDYEEGQYILTIQVFNLSQASPSGVETSQNVTTLYTTRGRTVSEAVNGIRQFVGKSPMFSHNRVLIVSEAAAETGISNILDYFIRDYSTRPSIDFAVTRGKAADILNADFGDATIPAEEIARMLESQSKKSRVQVMNIVNRYMEPGIDATAPCLETVKDEPKEGTGVRVSGAAILRDDKICGYLDSMQSQMTLLLNGSIKNNNLDLPIPEFGNVSLYFVSCDADYDVGLNGDQPYADVKVFTRFDISEIQNGPQMLEEEEIEKIRQAIQKYLEESCSQVLNVLMREYQSDVFGFGRMMMIEEPDYFKSVSDNWNDILPEMPVSVSMDVEIRRVGHESIRLGKE